MIASSPAPRRTPHPRTLRFMTHDSPKPLTRSQRATIAKNKLAYVIDQIHDAAYRDDNLDDATYKIVAESQTRIRDELLIVLRSFDA